MKRILFQGDSITDSHWREDDNGGMCVGYTRLVKAELSYLHPGEYEFYNRGIGGNRSVDLYARIKADFINLAPDYASILIGVNDVWHELDGNNGTDERKFERIYTMLVEELREALPAMKLFLLGAYVMPGIATVGTLPDGRDRYNVFRTEVEKRAAITKKIADRFGLPFVDLQATFDALHAQNGIEYYLDDGVHPSAAGYEAIKRAWLETFRCMSVE